MLPNPPGSHPLSTWERVSLEYAQQPGPHLRFPLPLATAWLSQPGQTCPAGHASPLFVTLKPFPSVSHAPRLCYRLCCIMSLWKKAGNWAVVAPARKVRVAPSPSTAPAALLPPKTPGSSHRRFWCCCPISCCVPLAALMISRRRQDKSGLCSAWYSLKILLTRRLCTRLQPFPAPSLFATEIGSTG